jgi:hypothetical protein
VQFETPDASLPNKLLNVTLVSSPKISLLRKPVEFVTKLVPSEPKKLAF